MIGDQLFLSKVLDKYRHTGTTIGAPNQLPTAWTPSTSNSLSDHSSLTAVALATSSSVGTRGRGVKWPPRSQRELDSHQRRPAHQRQWDRELAELLLDSASCLIATRSEHHASGTANLPDYSVGL